MNGDLAPGVYAKDVILHIIRKLGVNGGLALPTSMQVRSLRTFQWKSA